jgi:4-phosphopantoate--beta-alanine ligase
VNIPEDHPRYPSLMAREHLARMVQEGLVTPTGMISHGRGEAFDYLLGERTTASALRAEKAASAYLLNAADPVICVNGNAAALDPGRLVRLADATGAKIEVNIFHRTEERMELLISHMERNGARDVLGRHPDARIPGISSDRALCTKEGIFTSDVILVPIEDGDRAQALAAMGKTVIAIDLNPLSRTSSAASVSIADEMSRALENMIGFSAMGTAEIQNTITGFDNASNRRDTAEEMCRNLRSQLGVIR